MSCSALVRRYFSLTLADTVRVGPKLGALGEALACQSLRDSGFKKVRGDDRESPKYGSLLGRYQGRDYVIEVATRRKLKQDGQLNKSYKLPRGKASALYEAADSAETACHAKAAWVAVRLDAEDVFSAFFGTLLSLGRGARIPMGEKPLIQHQTLAEEKSILDALERGRQEAKEVFAFVSYADDDKDVARKLVQGLKVRLRDVFFAHEDARVGFQLTALIREKLGTSRFGIPLLTSRYFTSGWSQRELEMMLELRRNGTFDILPLRHQLQAQDAEAQLAQRQPHLDLVSLDLEDLGVDRAVTELLRAMTTHLRERGETAALKLLPAPE